ncbi:hypothetical protein BKI52_05275 [marine bacterium AO1-C]|nr:hypothetical protein BKI52_05275 [marine bacterium AO1-C]
MSIIVSCKGVQVGEFWIPPFEIDEGKLVGFFFHGDHTVVELQNYLIDIFAGKKPCEGIVVHQPLNKLSLYKTTWKDYFFPMTVKKFISSYIDKSLFDENLGFLEDENLKVRDLLPGQQKLLLLYKELSQTNKIVFNLDGSDPISLEFLLKQVRTSLNKQGGVYILMDHFDYKKNCDKYYEIKMIK